MSKNDQTKPAVSSQSIQSPVIGAQTRANCMLAMSKKKAFDFSQSH